MALPQCRPATGSRAMCVKEGLLRSSRLWIVALPLTRLLQSGEERRIVAGLLAYRRPRDRTSNWDGRRDLGLSPAQRECASRRSVGGRSFPARATPAGGGRSNESPGGPAAATCATRRWTLPSMTIAARQRGRRWFAWVRSEFAAGRGRRAQRSRFHPL